MDDGSRIRSHEIVVPRTSRYAVLGARVSDAREIWLVCHGYGQLAARFISRFSVLDDGKRMIVAPEALSRFYLSTSSGGYTPGDRVGASWMTREGRDAEITDQVTYLDLVCRRAFDGVDRSAVRFVAFGFSQGTAAVCRWAAATNLPPDEVILWGGAVPTDVLAPPHRTRLARATLTIVVGALDPIADAARTEAHRRELDGAGMAYRLRTYDGGHEIDQQTLLELASESRDGA